MSAHGHIGALDRPRSRRLATAVLVALTAVAIGVGAGAPSLASSAPDRPSTAAVPAGTYVPGQLLVRFAAGMTPAAVAAANATVGAATEKSFTDLVPGLQLVSLNPGLSVSDALVDYGQLAGVDYAQPNWISRIDAAAPTGKGKTPNDPRYAEQWGWPRIDAPAAWGKTTGSHSIVVTDIDTGMDYNHEDLAANAWHNTAECKGRKGVDDDKNGYVDDCYGIDPIDGDTDPIDDNGHGTHTAGTIGAVGNNKTGVTGMNWNVQVMPCKSHNAAGQGSAASIIECFAYVRMEKVEYGYDIAATNNSYGACPEACDFNPATYDAIKALIKPGVVMAFAAGNSARDNDIRPNFPSSYDLPNIISVAATDSSDNLANFSQWGLRSVDVGAPGVGVLSTLPDDTYGSLSGTSMATPHVAGLVALLHSADAKLDWSELRNLIIAGGDPVSSLKGKTVSGRRINAAGSLSCSKQKVFGMLNPVANTGSTKLAVQALNIDCAKPSGSVSVTITPGKTKLSLADNGKGADLVAGDGLYAAFWQAPCGGDFTFSFSTGDTYPVDVAACVKLNSRSGAPGSSLKVSGTGYGVGELVDVFFDQKLADTVTADSKGRIGDSITVPKSTPKGSHSVTASGQTSGLTASAPFKVT